VGRKGALFTTEDAETVARKLKAEYQEGRRPHKLAIVYYNGQRVTQFGIRRGSKEEGHGHLPKGIFLSPRETRLFADCTMSYEKWVEKMIEKDKIVVQDEELSN
jgi:hypothetical protein